MLLFMKARGRRRLDVLTQEKNRSFGSPLPSVPDAVHSGTAYIIRLCLCLESTGARARAWSETREQKPIDSPLSSVFIYKLFMDYFYAVYTRPVHAYHLGIFRSTDVLTWNVFIIIILILANYSFFEFISFFIHSTKT